MVFVTLFTKGPTKVQLRKTHDSVLEGVFKGHNLEIYYCIFPENTLITRPVFF